MKIATGNIVLIQKRQRDDVGEVFEYEGRILRGIFNDKVEMVRGMFDSGFIDDLISKKFMPKTWITDHSCSRYGLVLEHAKVWPVVYPQEWSYTMLQDAAIMVLDIARIARRYGYNMKDCHGLNVLFNGARPIFIDIGSFHANEQNVYGWECQDEFVRAYMYPLRIWSDGLEFLARLCLFSANLTSHSDFLKYNHPFLRVIKKKYIDTVVKIMKVPYLVSISKPWRISQYSKNVLYKICFSVLKGYCRIKFNNNSDLNSLMKRICIQKKRHDVTEWSNYHNVILKKANRFDYILNAISYYCPDAQTALDVAGNQGIFSKKLLSLNTIQKVICQDLDEGAIDHGYAQSRTKQDNNKQLTYVNYNIMASIIKSSFPSPWERYCSDIVISLALLHHLILSQGYSLADILTEFKKYSKKYVVIEFMPKGLWVYGAEVSVPTWYTLEWFREEFSNNFTLIHEHQTEENYVLFIGGV